MTTTIRPFQIKIKNVIKVSDDFGTHTIRITKAPVRLRGYKEISVEGIVLTTTCKMKSVKGGFFVNVGDSFVKFFRNSDSKVTKVN